MVVGVGVGAGSGVGVAVGVAVDGSVASGVSAGVGVDSGVRVFSGVVAGRATGFGVAVGSYSSGVAAVDLAMSSSGVGLSSQEDSSWLTPSARHRSRTQETADGLEALSPAGSSF